MSQLNDGPAVSESELLEIVNLMAADAAGVKFLRWLCHDNCAYQEGSATFEDGKVSPNATLYNEGRKDVWRLIRNYLLPDHLGKIESFDVALRQERLSMLEIFKPDQEQEQDESETGEEENA